MEFTNRKNARRFSKNVKKENVASLISNYSFNSTSTKLVTINDGKTVIEEYRRTTKNITLVPGPKGSLYPRIRSMSFPEDVGMVDYLGVRIGWIESPVRAGDAPLSSLRNTKIVSTLDDITDHMVSHYKVAHSALDINRKYIIVAKGSLYYRGRKCIVIEAMDMSKNILKVRCGKILEELLGNIEHRVLIKTGRVTNKGNVKDITIEVSEIDK